MNEIIAGIIANLLTMIGVKAAGKLQTRYLIEDPFPENYPRTGIDAPGETPLFLTRQRTYHRIELAKAKWDWLVLSTYYHPTAGRSLSVISEWLPTSIGGEFTTSDFVGRELPFESNMGEDAPTEIRVKILHSRVSIASNLIDTIDLLENEIFRIMPRLGYPDPPWKCEEIQPAWISLMTEVKNRKFDDLPNFNSFCGFSNLWSIQDTPASGIRPRHNANANIFAFAAVMELAWHLAQLDHNIQNLYSQNFDQAKHTPHQYGLRRVASNVLKTIWKSYSHILKT